MHKHSLTGLKEWLLILLSILLFLTALLGPFHFACAEPLNSVERSLQQAYHSGQIIRLHIIANSDSFRDQFVKLHVRDKLIEAFGKLLAEKGAISSDEVFCALEKQSNKMLETAVHSAQEAGFRGNVSAEVGILHLPEKSYGTLTLPEDEYRALRITLGEGKGKNWWCVLYPSLCLSLIDVATPSPDQHFLWTSQRIFQNWTLIGS